MILFFKHLGLTTTECSITYGSQPIFNGFFKLFIGAVADKFQRHLEMMLVFSLLSVILLSCLLLVPPVAVKYHPDPVWNGTLYYVCTRHGKSNLFYVECSVQNASRTCPIISKSNLDKHQWWYLFLDLSAAKLYLLEQTRMIENCVQTSVFNLLTNSISVNGQVYDIANQHTRFCKHFICEETLSHRDSPTGNQDISRIKYTRSANFTKLCRRHRATSTTNGMNLTTMNSTP